MNTDLMGIDTAMKYMRPELKAEYKRYQQDYPDISELANPFMNISDVLRAYFILADYFSDDTAPVATEKMLVGIRDMGLLSSAIGRQSTSFNGVVKYKQPLQVCAALFYGLVKNHAFADGNKRTALLTLLYQMDCYGFSPSASQKEYEKLVVAVAANKLPEEYRKDWQHTMEKDPVDKAVEVIARRLKGMTQKKNTSFHMDIIARDFAAALKNVPGCDCKIDGTKIRIQRQIEKKLGAFRLSSYTKSFVISYRGDTRIIGAATIREALETLELFEQYANYQTFFSGADPRYKLIEQFEGPLKRLKDK